MIKLNKYEDTHPVDGTRWVVDIFDNKNRERVTIECKSEAHAIVIYNSIKNGTSQEVKEL